MGEPVVLGPSSSRDSEAGAGWTTCTGPGAWVRDVPAGTKPLSWLRPSTLWQSRNDIIAKLLADPTPAARQRWLELGRRRAEESGQRTDLVVSRPQDGPFSVLVIGDPGEGDNSQYAVALPLTEHSKTADFAVICSDVVYPCGDSQDYATKFHHPYRDFQAPIYAVPGNHDWYDGLHGFMGHFCRLRDPGHRPDFGRGLRARLAALLWRKPGPLRAEPGAPTPENPNGDVPAPDPLQPAPYFAIDAGPLRFVGLDTGIRGSIDAEQYEWFTRVSLDAPERPKVLLTGKPIYVNNKYHPGKVLGSSATVDDVVTDPRANYRLVIGGDIHNYQRYPVTLDDGRLIQYVVSGGGGAYMHATHDIPPVNINGVTEEDFRCYPLRRDSLARFSQVIARRLSGGRRGSTIDARVAGRYYAERGVTTAKSERSLVERLSWAQALRVALVRRIPAGRLFHRLGSEVFDFNDPPFFKQFLRLDADPDNSRLTICCLGVTGCAGTELSPTVEDRFTITW